MNIDTGMNDDCLGYYEMKGNGIGSGMMIYL